MAGSGALAGVAAGPVLQGAPGPADRRRLRWERRARLWRLSRLRRLRNCGRAVRSLDGGVRLRSTEGVGGWAGLQHCGSVWACPVCAGRILVHRALEIGGVLGAALAAGHSLGFVTLTMRHRDGQALDHLWTAAGKAWGRATSGRAWVEETGVEGWVRVWEVTHGRNGWHVHVHLVVVLDQGATDADLDRVASGMFGRWSRGLQAAGLDAPLRRGQDWHLVRGERAVQAVAEYLAKFADAPDASDVVGRSMGLELTHSMPGRSAHGLRTRPTWALLDELAESGELGAAQLWWEWERVSKGKRQVAWSKGLRERFAPALDERTDDDIASEELGSRSDDVIGLDVEGWRRLVAHPGGPLFVVEALEAHGVQGASQALAFFGVDHVVLVDASTGGRWGGRPAAAGRPPPAPLAAPSTHGRPRGPGG